MRKRIIINPKKVYRIYTELGLKCRVKPRKKRLSMPIVPLQIPSSSGKVWSMDFVQDSFYSGKRFRILNIIDVFSRECVSSEAELSITAERVIMILDKLKANRNLPEQIVVDNGPEFTSKKFLKWAAENKVEIRFINKGRPMENGFVESFNGKFRNECLNENWFKDLKEAKQIITEWKEHYNTSRPHSSLGGMSPLEYLKKVA
jgi:putative transposase